MRLGGALGCIGCVLAAAVSAGAETVAVTNVRIVPVAGAVVERGTLVISNGRLTALGSDVAVPPGATVRDASGLTAYPGLVEIDTTAGLSEVGAVDATVDLDELGDFNPEARAYVAFLGDSEILPTLRANGVTTSLVCPRGGVLSGQAAFVQHDGWTWEDMVVVREAALRLSWPAEPEKVKKLKELFQAAREQPASTDLRLAPLGPYLKGERPVFVQASRQKDIEAAVAFLSDFSMKGAVLGAADAPKVLPLLREKQVAVVLPVLRLPAEREDPYDAAYTTPAELQRAGVRFAISTLSGADARNLPYHAAMAAAFGLPPDEALKAITLYPAEILGLASEVGSLAPGKRADVVLVRGDLLDARAEVVAVYIAGKPVDLETRHTRLYEKWRRR